jgi:hypothetical protein
MKNRLTYSLLLVLLASFAMGQAGGFFKVYDYRGGNNYFSAIEERKNQFHTVGISRVNGRLNGLMVKTSTAGDLEFLKELSFDSANTVETRTQGLAIDKDLNTYLSGYNTYLDSMSPAGYWRYPMLAKFDSLGNLLWYKNYIDSNYIDVWLQRCKLITTNRILAIGQFVNPNYDTSGVLLYLVDTAGNLISKKRISPFFNDNFWSSKYTFLSEQRILISGYTKYTNQARDRRALILLDSNLNVIWSKEYGPLTTLGNVFFGGSQERNGYLIIGGYINETISSWGGVALLEKIQLSDGKSLKLQKMELADVSTINDVFFRENGDLITMGGVDDLDSNSSDILIMRLDSNWNVLWKRRYTYPYRQGAFAPNENISEVIQLKEDGYLISGFTRGTDSIPSTQDAFLMKIDTNGCWQSGCQFVGLEPKLPAMQSINLYPNPARDILNIEHQEQGLELKVYSMQGSMIHHQLITENKSSIELSGWPNGLYLFRFSNGGLAIITHKVVVEH